MDTSNGFENNQTSLVNENVPNQLLYKYCVHQLLDIMGSLLDRPLIKKDFEEKYPILVEKMNQELDTAKAIYDAQVAVKGM